MDEDSFILLIEDSPTDVDLILSVMKRQGISSRIVTIRDGEEALDFLFSRGQYLNRQRPTPSLILLDKHLPKIDGLEILGRVKTDLNLARVPTLMFSCSIIAEDRDEACKRGANAVIEKPLDFGEFTQVLAQVITYWTKAGRPPAARVERTPEVLGLS